MSFEYFDRWNQFKGDEDIVDDPKFKTTVNRRLDSDELDPFTGHQHDHHEEREFFEQPESVKMKCCEDHRVLGNYFFNEGLYNRACHRFKLALSYYEYCFPENPEEENKLELVRYACLCNVSLCYIRMGFYRDAIESASKAINMESLINFNKGKAFFRRSQAHRALDNYPEAQEDLLKALEFEPNDVSIIDEQISLKKQMANAFRNEKLTAKRAMQDTNMSSQPSGSLETDAVNSTLGNRQITGQSDFKKLSPILNIFIPVEPSLEDENVNSK